MRNDCKYYTTLEELYIDNRKLIFSYLQDGDIADVELQEELASELWLKVWEREESFLEKDKRWVKNYLRIMIKNTISDYYRKVKCENKAINKIGTLIELSDRCVTVESEIYAKEMMKILGEGLKCLSDKEASLIIMRFKYNLSAKEIGNILDITEGNVRVKQMRIMIKLRKTLSAMMMGKGNRHGK